MLRSNKGNGFALTNMKGCPNSVEHLFKDPKNV